MSQSPAKPWGRGQQPTYTALQLTVNLCQDEFGNVWSDHDFASPGDQEIAAGLPQGGIPQVAHVLLTEAVRREVFTSALVHMSQEPAFLAKWAHAGEAERKVMENDLVRATWHVLSMTISKMLPGAVTGVLAMLEHQGVQHGAQESR